MAGVKKIQKYLESHHPGEFKVSGNLFLFRQPVIHTAFSFSGCFCSFILRSSDLDRLCVFHSSRSSKRRMGNRRLCTAGSRSMISRWIWIRSRHTGVGKHIAVRSGKNSQTPLTRRRNSQSISNSINGIRARCVVNSFRLRAALLLLNNRFRVSLPCLGPWDVLCSS